MKNNKIYTTLALLGLLLFSYSAEAQEMQSRDDMIAAEAFRIIGNNIHYTVWDIVGIGVSEGLITLEGWVTADFKKDRYVRALRKQFGEGVEINDKIKILSGSNEDNRLRYLIARKIYNDHRLFYYGLGNGPKPIHIIVHRGRVMLEGQVHNEMDRRLVRSKARDVFGVISLTNNLVVGKSDGRR